MTAFSRWAIGIMCIVMIIMLIPVVNSPSKPDAGVAPYLFFGLTLSYLSLVVAGCIHWRWRRLAGRIAAAITAAACAALGVFAVFGPPDPRLPPGTWLDRLPACLPALGFGYIAARIAITGRIPNWTMRDLRAWMTAPSGAAKKKRA